MNPIHKMLFILDFLTNRYTCHVFMYLFYFLSYFVLSTLTQFTTLIFVFQLNALIFCCF